MDEVIPRLFLGCDEAAMDWPMLQMSRITRIINLATDVKNEFPQVVLLIKLRLRLILLAYKIPSSAHA